MQKQLFTEIKIFLCTEIFRSRPAHSHIPGVLSAWCQCQLYSVVSLRRHCVVDQSSSSSSSMLQLLFVVWSLSSTRRRLVLPPQCGLATPTNVTATYINSVHIVISPAVYAHYSRLHITRSLNTLSRQVYKRIRLLLSGRELFGKLKSSVSLSDQRTSSVMIYVHRNKESCMLLPQYALNSFELTFIN